MVSAFIVAMDQHGVPEDLKQAIIDSALKIAIQRSPQVPTVFPPQHQGLLS